MTDKPFAQLNNDEPGASGAEAALRPSSFAEFAGQANRRKAHPTARANTTTTATDSAVTAFQIHRS